MTSASSSAPIATLCGFAHHVREQRSVLAAPFVDHERQVGGDQPLGGRCDQRREQWARGLAAVGGERSLAPGFSRNGVNLRCYLSSWLRR